LVGHDKPSHFAKAMSSQRPMSLNSRVVVICFLSAQGAG
jgi:hypothetical protein